MLLNFDCEVLLTYSPITEVTGHMYEVADYYLLLSKSMSCRMLMMTEIPKEFILESIFSKYDLTEEEQKQFAEDLTVANNYFLLKIISTTGIALITDGNIGTFIGRNMLLRAKQIFCFKCGNYDLTPHVGNSIYGKSVFLQDYRVYGQPDSSFQTKHYVKKLMFDRYKKTDDRFTNTALLYLTKNCRHMDVSAIEEITESYPQYNFLILSPEADVQCHFSNHHKIMCYPPPIPDLFSQFDVYIYTPVPRQFDCSPRLISECAFYEKRVIYHNINYHDLGLETRKKDIDNGIENITLTENDAVFSIFRQALAGEN